MRRFYIIISILVFSNVGCALFENFDELPMFVKVENVGVTTTVAEGSSSHKIIDIWPNADGQSLGVFEIPTKFPVLDTDDKTEMTYFAGIKRLGFAQDHTIYPFYNSIVVDRTFNPDTEVIEDLNFQYREGLKFRVLEDFELNHVFDRDIDDDPETQIELTSEGGFEGKCGLVKLTKDNPRFTVATNGSLDDLPINGTAVYLEIDYKTDINLNIGLQVVLNGMEVEQYFVSLSPNSNWNKVYIDMAEILQDSGFDSYSLILGALSDVDEDVEIRFDNIKLLHF